MKLTYAWVLAFAALLLWPTAFHSQSKANWRTATPTELEGFLPARAPVEKERIETEMRTATGITDGAGKTIAAVVLITAGYAAEGKYSHYLLTQAPVRMGADLALPPGAYVLGWNRTADGLLVHFFSASNGVERGSVIARPLRQPVRVEPLRIWPPGEKPFIQIGRFCVPYTIE